MPGTLRGTPRVSVLMPSYNHAPFVAQAIESVLGQSFEDLELIVTDDGSTDGTPDIVRRYRDPRLSLEIFPQNQGACQATNRCLERARGEYIALLNSDDYYMPGKLARQVAIMDRRPGLGAVFSQAHLVDEAGAPVTDRANPFTRLFTTIHPNRYAWLRMFFFQGNGLCQPTALARRRIYQEIGPFDPALRQLHDFDMWVRLCARYPIHVMPEATLHYRVLTTGGNASAPGASVFRRTQWEHTRIRHRYRAMDEATLRHVFIADIPQSIAARNLPMPLALALAMAARPEPALQLFALETLQHAVDQQQPGIGPKDLHAVSGAIDPLRVTEFNANLEAALEATHQRDGARMQVEALAAALERQTATVAASAAALTALRDEMTATMTGLRGPSQWQP